MIKFTVIPKTLFGTWQFGKIDVLVNFIIQKFATLKSLHFFSVFLVRSKSEKIASIHFADQASVVERQKKKFCYPYLSFGKEDNLIIILSA